MRAQRPEQSDIGSPSSARSTRAYSERSAWNGPSDEDMVAHQERARLSVKCPRPVLLLRHRVDERTMHEGVMRLEPDARRPDNAAVGWLHRIANGTSTKERLQVVRIDQALRTA